VRLICEAGVGLVGEDDPAMDCCCCFDWECFGWLLWSHLDRVTAGDSRGAWRQCVFLVGRVVWCFLMHTCVQGQAPENGCM